MKPLALTIAAVALSAAIAGPAAAGHNSQNRYDNSLSRKEAVREVMRSFDRLDRNNNGVVSFREVRRANNKGRNHRNSGYDRHNASFEGIYYDRNGLEIRIGNSDRRDYGYRKGNKSQLINTGNFHRYDRNNDGRITHKEAKKTVKRRFERADRNHNGRLSRREIERSNWYSTSGGRGRDYNDRDRNGRRR